MKKEELQVATTPYIAGQEYFVLPVDAWPKLDLTIFNKKKNEWRKAGFDIFIRPHGKKKKTDETIKINYESRT